MSILSRKIGSWLHPISDEVDKPVRSASEMKAVFDSNSNELKTALNGLIDDLQDGKAEVGFSEASVRANIESGESEASIFGKIRKWFSDLKGIAFTVIPLNGTSGQFLRLRTSGTLDMEWASGSGSVEQIQADFTDEDPTSAAYVRNRPIIAEDITVAVSAFELDEDETCEEHPYKALAAVSGVTADMNRAEVTFADGDRYMFAGICKLAAGGVTIYSSHIPIGAITIPTIVVWR